MEVKKSLLIPTDRRDAQSAGQVESNLEQVRKALAGIRFGEVRLIVQDGVLVQIDRVEKQRLR